MKLTSKELCLALMKADTSDEIVGILGSAGYWDDPSVWRPMNDDESNYSTIGNQQSDAIAALSEKIINSVDARLVDAVLRAGVDPTGPNAPATMREAVAKYLQGKDASQPSAGRLSHWSDKEITEQARLITVAATGNKPEDGAGNPSISIADDGEGQTPDQVSSTFMSLSKSNKLRIPFVQGKFSMGGTGALQFCAGPHKLQLVVTRRDAAVLGPDATERDKEWSFTVVRREPPAGNARNSVFTYLAPVQGSVISFASETMPIFPNADSTSRGAYERDSDHGSLIKLYEYELSGSKSNIVFSGGGLLGRLETALPELALPVRMYECRAYKGKSGSYATNLLGLVLRLDRDRASNVEDESPIGAGVMVAGVQIPLRVYVFKDRKSAGQYRVSRQGVVFGLNGQSHGSLPDAFFRRKKVGLNYLADSMLVFADCSAIEGQTREELFMNSRDRLRETTLSHALESAIESALSQNEVLAELNNRHRKQLVDQKLEEDRPLVDVLKDLIDANPMLSKLLSAGLQVPVPFGPSGSTIGSGKGSKKVFEGKRYPTHFRIKGTKSGETKLRESQIGRKTRIVFETDAEDGYFTRAADPGFWRLRVKSDTGDFVDALAWDWTGPVDGVAHMSVDLPEDAMVGDQLHFRSEVTDDSRDDALDAEFVLTVAPNEPNTGGGKGGKTQGGTSGTGGKGGGTAYALPNITRVREEDWEPYGFGPSSAIKIEGNPEGGHDFFVNVDNKFLRTLEKSAAADSAALESQFTYGMVLIGLALIQDGKRHEADDDDPIEELVARTTTALAPILIPMLQSIGNIASV